MPSEAQASENAVVKRVTWIGLFFNLALSALKFAAGVLGNSQAVVADAVHSLSDCGTDIVLLVGVRFWGRPPDESHPHGHRRVETLIVSAIGISLAVVAIGLAWKAFEGIREQHAAPPGWVAFGAAMLSIIGKEWLYRWTSAAGRRIKSSSLVANAWHHRSDSLSSIPAAVAVLGARLRPDWQFLDHIGAILVSLLILKAAYDIAKPALAKLVDAGIPEQERRQILEIASLTEHVTEVHEIRTRYIGCNSVSVDLHVLVDGSLTVRQGHDIATEVKRRLLDGVEDVVDVVVHIEPSEESRGPDGHTEFLGR